MKKSLNYTNFSKAEYDIISVDNPPPSHLDDYKSKLIDYKMEYPARDMSWRTYGEKRRRRLVIGLDTLVKKGKKNYVRDNKRSFKGIIGVRSKLGALGLAENNPIKLFRGMINNSNTKKIS